jgi:hypothetical protein
MTFFIKQGINNQYSVDSTIVSLHVTQLGKFWNLVMCLLRAAPCIATRLRCRDCWERIEWAIRTQRLLQVADTPHVKARRSEAPHWCGLLASDCRSWWARALLQWDSTRIWSACLPYCPSDCSKQIWSIVAWWPAPCYSEERPRVPVPLISQRYDAQSPDALEL